MPNTSLEFKTCHWTSNQIGFYSEFINGTEEISDLELSNKLDSASKCRVWNNQVILKIRLCGKDVNLDCLIAMTIGDGHGRKAFQWLKELAHKHNVPILLIPCSIEHPYEDRVPYLPDDEKITQFYKSEGCRPRGYEMIYCPSN